MITIMDNSRKLNFGKNSKLRVTRQRAVIHEQLTKAKTHPTVEEIYKMVKKRLPKVSLGTVYRNLEVLAECGFIRKLELGLTQRRYDAELHKHYHIRCVGCSRVEDIPCKSIEICSEVIKGSSDYDIFGHEIEFFGLCPLCKGKGKPVDGGIGKNTS